MPVKTLLKDQLYRITAHSAEADSLRAEVDLSLSHEIFRGHFPGRPILPGVCTLQICKELVSEHLGGALHLTHCTAIKYVKLVEPQTTPTLRFAITLKTLPDSSHRIEALVTTVAGETVAKLSLVAGLRQSLY